MLAKYVESLSKHYYKVRWNCYKIATALYISKCDGQLLQIATAFLLQLCDTVYYKLRQVFQSAINLLQIATDITKCDDYYKLRQYASLFLVEQGWRSGESTRLPPV